MGYQRLKRVSDPKNYFRSGRILIHITVNYEQSLFGSLDVNGSLTALHSTLPPAASLQEVGGHHHHSPPPFGATGGASSCGSGGQQLHQSTGQLDSMAASAASLAKQVNIQPGQKRIKQGCGAGAGLFCWSRSRHFATAPALV